MINNVYNRVVLFLIALFLLISAEFVNSSLILSIAHSEEKQTVELSAQELAARLDNILTYPDGKIKGKMVHKMPNGKAYNVDVVAVVNKSDYYFKVISHTRGEEEKILYNSGGEVIWVYDLISKKLMQRTFTERYSKIMGTNFSYDDLSNAKFQGNFNAKIIGDDVYKDEDVYRLKLTPIYKRGGCYGSIVVFMRKKDHYPMRIDYYDTNSVIDKRLFITKYITKDNRLFPVRYVMMNMITGTLTELDYFGFINMSSFDKKKFNYKYITE